MTARTLPASRKSASITLTMGTTRRDGRTDNTGTDVVAALARHGIRLDDSAVLTTLDGRGNVLSTHIRASIRVPRGNADAWLGRLARVAQELSVMDMELGETGNGLLLDL